MTLNGIDHPELLKIGDLARKTGKTVRALHLYEELGLLRPVSRTSGGFRLFDADSLQRLHWISLLQEMGLSLHQIQDLLRDWWSGEHGPESMARLREVFKEKLVEARNQARRYEQLAAEIENSIQYFETCRSCFPAPRVETCTQCPRDHGMEDAPLLVKGLHGSRAAAEPADLIQIDTGGPSPAPNGGHGQEGKR
jgi:MerR family transcriptional regulator, copper efflux regulator